MANLYTVKLREIPHGVLREPPPSSVRHPPQLTEIREINKTKPNRVKIDGVRVAKIKNRYIFTNTTEQR